MSKDSTEQEVTYIFQEKDEAALEQVLMDLIEQSFNNNAA